MHPSLCFENMKGSSSSAVMDINSESKEWDETTCPICLDHPHNAVLLICSSHEKGCRSYICDSSYRHSNCLDRFKNLRDFYKDNPSPPSSSFHESSISRRLGRGTSHRHNSEPSGWGPRVRNLAEPEVNYGLEENEGMISAGLSGALHENNTSQERGSNNSQDHSQEDSGGVNTSETDYLKCPLCRGSVLGWMIVKEAREYLDLKPRSCALEECSFSGNYGELRRHARRMHPLTKPAVVDPARQRAWRRLERQQEHGDILSAIRSAMPGAVVLGDYVMDSAPNHLELQQEHGGIFNAIRAGAPGAVVQGDYQIDDEGVLLQDRETNNGNGPLWNMFYVFHVTRSPDGSVGEPRFSSRTRRTPQYSSTRDRNLWGDILDLQDDEDDDWELNTGIPMPRRHQRFTRSRVLDDDDVDDDIDWDLRADISVPRRRPRFTRSRLDNQQL